MELKNLTKKYGKFTAVDNLDFNIKKGEIFGFLGPNGAGKTTTIKMACGLVSINSGDVLIDGVSIKKGPMEYKRKIALIPDKPYMFEKLRGIEYIRFIANLYSVREEKYKKLLEKYAGIFGVEGFINDFIESYSHGMSQKMLIIASLIHSPDVFILDEPMVGLDPKSQKILKEEFKKLSKEGMTIFMSTHSIKTAEDVCDTVGIIDKGKMIEKGSLSGIKKRAGEGELEDIFFKLTEEKTEK